MPPALTSLIAAFVQPAGSFMFFAGTFLAMFAVLGMSLSSNQASLRRMRRASILSLLVWASLLLALGFASLTGQDANRFLPPLEQAAGALMVIVWAWAFLEIGTYERLTNNIALALGLALAGLYALTGVLWSTQASAIDFNFSYGAYWVWGGAMLSIVAALLCIAFIGTVSDAPLKALVFASIFAANALQLLVGPLIGNYSGLQRIGLLLALALVVTVVYRRIVAELVAVKPTAQAAKPSASASTEMPAVRATQSPARTGPLQFRPVVDSSSALLLKALGLILDDPSYQHIPERVVAATLDLVKGDVGALLRQQDANYLDILYAYDRTMQRRPQGISVNLGNQATLANALERRTLRGLFVERNQDELNDLYTRLDIDQFGPTYWQPIVYANEVIAVLMVGFPYASRELDDANLELLKSLAIMCSGLLALSFEAEEARRLAEDRAIQAIIEGLPVSEVTDTGVLQARQEMQASLQLARDQISDLSRQVMQLQLRLDDERSRLAALLDGEGSDLSISQRIVAVRESQKELRLEREQLLKRLQEAETALLGATSSGGAISPQLLESLTQERDALLLARERLTSELKRVNELAPETLLQTIAEERTALESERNQLRDKLTTIENQLSGLGLDDSAAGFSTLIAQLYDERKRLQHDLETAIYERDMLLKERTRMASAIGQEKERQARLLALQGELENLANDRETAIKQRDRYKTELLEAKQKLDIVKEHRARLLAQIASFEMELHESLEEQSRLRARMQSLADGNSSTDEQVSRLRAQVEALMVERDQLIARAEGDRERLKQLGDQGVGALRRMIEELSEERRVLQQELNALRSKQADSVQARGMVLQESIVGERSVPMPQPEVLMSLLQELRTPMTSLTGYVSLLLNEAAGILFEMQRKFLLRVSSNVARLDTMIDDLIHIMRLDTGQYTLEPNLVDVVKVIETAIAHTQPQIREKGISLNLDLQRDLPAIQADLDAVGQMVGQMLTNAYLISPPNSDIAIRVQRRSVVLDPTDESLLTDCVYVAIEDSGGGIAMDDLPRIFVRKYKAENPLIQGLGDTGVGMAIAKALIEAHRGRMWVEVKVGLGSIFSFALPIEKASD